MDNGNNKTNLQKHKKMSEYFIAAAQAGRVAEDGIAKRVAEQYLVDAESFTEAEALVCRAMEENGGTDGQITRMVKPRLAGVSLAGDGAFYRVRIAIAILDEKTASEKKKPATCLVQAGGLEAAIAAFRAGMAPALDDWTLTAVTETGIVGHITGRP